MTASLLQSFYVNFCRLFVCHQHYGNHSNNLQMSDFHDLSAFCTHASSLQEKLVPCLPFLSIAANKQEPAELSDRKLKAKTVCWLHNISSLQEH
jgi:hypothetical protein